MAKFPPGIELFRRFSTAICLRIADLLVLALVAQRVLAASAKLFPASELWLHAILVFASIALAGRRLIAWRQNSFRPTVAARGWAQRLAIAGGVIPWCMLPLLKDPIHIESFWSAMTLPVSVRPLGAVLIVLGVLSPFLIALQARLSGAWSLVNSSSSTRPIEICAFAVGLFLLWPSPLVGVFSAGSLAMVCCELAGTSMTSPMMQLRAATS